MVKRAVGAAKLGQKAHAHMPRHACGFKLANDGIDTRPLEGDRAQQYPEYGSLYGAGVGAVQELLAGTDANRQGRHYNSDAADE